MDTHENFVAARRSTLIEEYGGGVSAEAAVDRALVRCRRSWARLERTTDVERHVREMVADELERPRRRRLTLVALGAVLLIAAAIAALALRPAPPAVRPEVNRVPVPWFADGELHLAKVVVSLPGAGAFVPVDDGVVIQAADGTMLRVDDDGAVEDFQGTLPRVTLPDAPVPEDPDASDRLDVTLTEDGDPVHLMEIALSRHEEEIYLRNSETVRRMFLFCGDAACEEWERVVVASTDVRLR